MLLILGGFFILNACLMLCKENLDKLMKIKSLATVLLHNALIFAILRHFSCAVFAP